MPAKSAGDGKVDGKVGEEITVRGEGRILLTVFEPFDGADVNASQEVGRAIAAADERIEMLVLPVAAGAAEEMLIARLDAARLDADPAPRFVVSLGEAGPETVVRLEMVAINYDDFRIPDNAGQQPRGSAIHSGAPHAFFATLPVESVARALEGVTPLPAIISLSAGAFVCNHLAYQTLRYLDTHSVCSYGFVHVPKWRPDSDLSLNAIVETMRAVLDILDRECTKIDAPPARAV